MQNGHETFLEKGANVPWSKLYTINKKTFF